MKANLRDKEMPQLAFPKDGACKVRKTGMAPVSKPGVFDFENGEFLRIHAEHHNATQKRRKVDLSMK